MALVSRVRKLILDTLAMFVMLGSTLIAFSVYYAGDWTYGAIGGFILSLIFALTGFGKVEIKPKKKRLSDLPKEEQIKILENKMKSLLKKKKLTKKERQKLLYYHKRLAHLYKERGYEEGYERGFFDGEDEGYWSGRSSCF